MSSSDPKLTLFLFIIGGGIVLFLASILLPSRLQSVVGYGAMAYVALGFGALLKACSLL